MISDTVLERRFDWYIGAYPRMTRFLRILLRSRIHVINYLNGQPYYVCPIVVGHVHKYFIFELALRNIRARCSSCVSVTVFMRMHDVIV